jgi:hypothetical protein
MFGSTILDVAVGVIFVFILVSIICSAIREGIESILKTRAAHLEHGIRELLHDRAGTGLAKDLFQHPLVAALYANDFETARRPRDGQKRPWALARGGHLPSYIPSRNFAVALMDLAVRGREITPENSSAGAPVISIEALRDGVSNLQNEKVQRVLLVAIDSAQGDLNRAQANLEAWYDGSMDRVSGWYKRSTHRVLFVIGLATAIILNIDTIAIADHLYRDDAARAVLVARATAAARADSVARANRRDTTVTTPTPAPGTTAGAAAATDSPAVQTTTTDSAVGTGTLLGVARPDTGRGGTPQDTSTARRDSSEYERAMSDLDALPIPLGWGSKRPQLRAAGECKEEQNKQKESAFKCNVRKAWLNWTLPVVGWLLTALAATLGAPFWFDVLNKVMVIRSTVKPYEKSGPEGSEDRKSDRKPAAASGGTPPRTAAGASGTLPSGAAAATAAGAAASTTAGGVAGELDDDLDGCSVEVEVETPDEHLPPAHGGVE